MTGNDMATTAFRPKPNDIMTAFGLLTRLPLPMRAFNSNDTRPPAHAAWAYPLVGVFVACFVAFVGWALMTVGLPATAAALLALLAGIIVTGALHEDGLADCADGFWGGWTRERRLAIMKDSQIGTYGVIALVVGLALRWMALTALLNAAALLPAVLAAAVMSRAAMVAVMYALPHARSSGLSQQTGKPPLMATICAGALGLCALLFGLTSSAFVAIFMVILATLACAFIAKRKIGGQTGDVLGATQQIVEITLLLISLSALP